MAETKCGSEGCVCGNPENCDALDRYKKLVYCSVESCAHNISISPGKFVKHHKDWKALGPDDAYRGICSRLEIGIKENVFSTPSGAYHRPAECRFRSDKKIKGHMDFSRFLNSDGTSQGGNISPGPSGDTVYH